MNKLFMAAMISLSVMVFSGCSTIDTIFGAIDRIQKPVDIKSLEYLKIFEEGRRAECSLDGKNSRYDNMVLASDKYKELIKLGNRYGYYGLARFFRNWYPFDSEHNENAIRYFVACAQCSSYASDKFPDSVVDSAFSVAAMAELADIASERIVSDDKDEVVQFLHYRMSKVVTQDVRAWAYTMKTNTVSKKIFEGIISAIESDFKTTEYVNEFKWKWGKIRDVLINGTKPSDMPGARKQVCSSVSPYSVVSFVKVPRAVCQYDFEAQLFGSNTFDAIDKVKSALRRQLVNDFRAAHPSFSVNDVGISFPSWNHSGSTIKGTVDAKALKMEVERREYNKDTGKGKVRVRLGDNDVAAAEKLAIENIESIATRHNILNVVGELPPKGAHYEIIKSGKTHDGLFEIEFKCE